MKLEIVNLQKSFKEKHVLNDVNFSVSSGNALGVLGRNGAGKTTLIRIILDLFKSDSGDIKLDGQPFDRKKHKIGYLPEERGLYPKKTLLDQLTYFGQLKGLSKAKAHEVIDDYLNRLELSDYKNKKLETLSKGNQQKVQLIVALIDDPDIVILDEPFSGLDPVTAQLLKDIVIDLIQKNKLVLFSSHQMNHIEEFCQNIVILNGGKIVLAGNLNQIKHNYPKDKVIINCEDPNSLQQLLPFTTTIKNDHLEVDLTEDLTKEIVFNSLNQQLAYTTGFYLNEPSLNDIFVRYTKEGI